MQNHTALIRFGATAAALLLAACGVQSADRARIAQDALVGKTVAEIVACAGVPSGRHVVGDTEVLAYVHDRGSIGGGVAVPIGNMVVVDNDSMRLSCTANFVFRRGRLETINYRSASYGLIPCGPIVEACLKR